VAVNDGQHLYLNDVVALTFSIYFYYCEMQYACHLCHKHDVCLTVLLVDCNHITYAAKSLSGHWTG